MEKRLPLALFLSFLVLFGWQIVFPPPAAPEAQPDSGQGQDELAQGSAEGPAVVPGDTGAEGGGAKPAAQPQGPAVVAEKEERVTLTFGNAGEPGYFEASFSNRGGRLEGLKLGNYFTHVGFDDVQRVDHANWMSLIEPIQTEDGVLGSLLFETSTSSETLFPFGLSEVFWQMETLPGGSGVRFQYGPPGTDVLVTKEIKGIPGTWRLALTFTIQNNSAGPSRGIELRLRPTGAMVPEFHDRFYPEPRTIVVGGAADDLQVEWEGAPSVSEPGSLDVPTPIAYVGAHNKYFAFLVHGAEDHDRKTLRAPRYEPVREMLPDGAAGRSLVSTLVPLALRLPDEGASTTWRYEIYAGPKAPEAMTADAADHIALLDEDLSSWFTLIALIGKGLLWVMAFFHGVTGNWGVAIILLTICVRAGLFPLNRRTQTAMARYQKKMKRVQPRMDEVKKRYADDLQKQREAQAKIMQEEGAFPPLGGCLPIFFQFPVFIGLFSALRTSFDLRQAPFVSWIVDLSKPDRLLRLDFDLPLLITTIHIEYLNLLPLLMIGLMIWQQQGMPKPTDEQAQRMQRMMMVMPFLFAFFLYNYGAGLALYVITSSAIGIIEQKVIKKVWPIDDTELEKKKKPGCGPFSGMMQQFAEKQKEQMRLMEARKKSQAPQGGTKKARKKKR